MTRSAPSKQPQIPGEPARSGPGIAPIGGAGATGAAQGRSARSAARIHAAALRLFARDGFAAVSMRQIAAEVGLQVGALYNHTPDKQALLMTLMQGHMEALLAALAASGDAGEPARRLDHFVRFHIRYHAARPDAVFIAYMELRNLTPDNFARIESLRRAYEDHLESILAEGIAGRAFSCADARVATRAIIAMLTGVTTWFRPDGRLSLSEVEEVYAAMALKSVEATGG